MAWISILPPTIQKKQTGFSKIHPTFREKKSYLCLLLLGGTVLTSVLTLIRVVYLVCLLYIYTGMRRSVCLEGANWGGGVSIVHLQSIIINTFVKTTQKKEKEQALSRSTGI